MGAAIPHPSFELIQEQHIDALKLDFQRYKHKVTGAEHYHFASDNPENVFLVALKTVPTDSTGVAHILEHTALCGSEKYPVRDPFFMMLRRSLNTFMNAMTSTDWTAYPFASCNKKDFNNLLEVYLDAVFFSRLDELDFAQEGHRLEFDEAENSESDLVYKGVVFNEMKGAMSSVTSQLWQSLSSHLFPSNTYHHNSGGEPANIPDLSYDELKTFYAQHYHPSNAVFMTFGDIDARDHQLRFEGNVLNRFELSDAEIDVPLEQRLTQAIKVTERYTAEEGDSPTDKSHVAMGWLWGESTDPVGVLEANLLAGVLLDNSASPLRKALETTKLGAAPSPLCGAEESNREIVFACGLEGCDAEQASVIEALIIDTLNSVCENGIPAEDVEAVLHQLELHQREVGGDGYPYGMQLMFQVIGAAIHGSDPLKNLDLDNSIAVLRERAASPDYISGLIRRLILENQHQVTLTMVPDSQLSDENNQQEIARLAAIKSQLSDTEKQAIISQTAALLERQSQEDDPAVLPKVGVEDVPRELPEQTINTQSFGNTRLNSYAAGCNGLSYQHIVATLPELTADEAVALPYFSGFLTEVGLGDKSYLDIQQHQTRVIGDISSSLAMRTDLNDSTKMQAYLSLSSKALVRNHDAQSVLTQETLKSARFDETERLVELISQARTRRERSITGNGHALAMNAASANFSQLGNYQHQQQGLAAIQSLKAFDDGLTDESQKQNLVATLQTLQSKISQANLQVLQIADPHLINDLNASLGSRWASHVPHASGHYQHQLTSVPQVAAYQTNTQVNFCAAAYPAVTSGHADAPALSVLAGYLRNGFLHRAIREQGGAYGGGASFDSNTASFRFFSYRDPRMLETLADFNAAISWLMDEQHPSHMLEEAILGVIGSMDKPASPAGEARKHFYQQLFGRSHQQHLDYREAVMTVSLDDLHRVSESYLSADAHIAVVTHQDNAEAFASSDYQATIVKI